MFVLNKSEKKASWRTRKKLLGCLRMCVYKKPQSETGNKRLREPHKTRSQENKYGGAEERTKDACGPQKQLLSLLSSCPPHQLTQLQQTSPMLSSTPDLNQQQTFFNHFLIDFQKLAVIHL
jgi:hypothetical protein